MATPAIEVEGVSKRFRISQGKYTSLKERAINFGRVAHEDFWALRDIDITINAGETLGLLGHNGSGKSTLLKCIAGILQPTVGYVATTGTMAALLELGAGFHPDLTGRENVYLNASFLGLSKKDIDLRFDDIVDFAGNEVAPFIDQQVRHYSSGMYVRLGFSVAVNVEPDILLVDEVLAVGDENFQRKCLDRIRLFQKEGRTIVFVTHAADLVRQICDRAVVLDHGLMVASGTPGEAVRSFREHLMKGERYDEAAMVAADPALVDADGQPIEVAETEPELTHGEKQVARKTSQVQITAVTMEYPESPTRPYLLPGEPLSIGVQYEASTRIENSVFGIAVHDMEGNLVFGSNTQLLDVPMGAIEGPGEVTFAFDSIPLFDGTYLVSLAVISNDAGIVYEWREQQYQFEVMNPGRSTGMVAMPLQVRTS